MNKDTIDALAAQGGVEPKVAEGAKELADEAKKDLPDITIQKPTELAVEVNKAGEPAKDINLNKTVNKTLAEAGYTEEILTERLVKDGGISDEFVEELRGKIDPDFVDAHVGRLRAELELTKIKEAGKVDDAHAEQKATKSMNDYIFQSVGGEDKFKILGKALKENISADALSAINVKLASGNKTVVTEALESAIKEYNNIRGMGGKLMEGDAFSSTEPQEHITKEEYRALMRTDKYKTDPKYARKVDADRLKTRELDSQRFGPGHYFGFHKDKGKYAL